MCFVLNWALYFLYMLLIIIYTNIFPFFSSQWIRHTEEQITTMNVKSMFNDSKTYNKWYFKTGQNEMLAVL